MPRPKTGAPGRPAGEIAGTERGRSSRLDPPEVVRSRNWPGKAAPWARQRDCPVNRNLARYEIVAGCMGDGSARLVLLVVDYLCHVIVHFSCMNEMGCRASTAARGSNSRITRCARDSTICRKADGGEERAAISQMFRNDQEAGAFADVCPASWVLMGKVSAQ